MRTAVVSLVLLASACQSDTKDGPVTWSDVTGKPSSFPTTWAEVAEKPATFPAAWSDVSGVPTTFPSDWSQIANHPATFPTDWASVAGKPTAYPTDPTAVQQRVTASCANGAAIAAIDVGGSVTCTAPRPVTVQLPAPTWATFQCASVSSWAGLGGFALPALRFDPVGTCGTGRSATTAIAVPLELPPGPRPFRMRAVVSALSVRAPVELSVEWGIAVRGAGIGATSCRGTSTVTVPMLSDVQEIASVEFDFRADPTLCGEPGDTLVLLMSRTDAEASNVAVRAIHLVFE